MEPIEQVNFISRKIKEIPTLNPPFEYTDNLIVDFSRRVDDFYKLMKLNNSYLFFVSVVDDNIWDSDFDNADMVFKIFNDCYDYLKNITNKIVLVGDKFDNALC